MTSLVATSGMTLGGAAEAISFFDLLQDWREGLGDRFPALPGWEAPQIPGVPIQDS